jgi:hypothetical protein
MSEMITPFDPVPDGAIWKVLGENDNYAVSEYGHVMRVKSSRTSAAGRLLKAQLDSVGYPRYGLMRDGERYFRNAHRIVAACFIGNPPDDSYEVAHWDGTRTNCHFSNLRWATRRENVGDRKRHGTDPMGEMNGQSKLTEKEVREIYHASGIQREIARKFGVSFAMVSLIKSGKKWKCLALRKNGDAPRD